MSISTKTVRGNKYLVFQWYQNGTQRFEYLGRESDDAWEKAWKRLKIYHFERLEEFYSRLPQVVRDKLPLYRDLKQQAEERYRLLEAVKPQVEAFAGKAVPLVVETPFEHSRSRTLLVPAKKKRRKAKHARR